MDKKKMDYDKLKNLLMELSECGGNSYSASDEYNIFEVLGVEYKEVIMCRFIGDLLDCKGKHGLGTVPLRLFIQDVLGDKNVGDNLDESNIILEDSTDNGRRVDIAIYLKDRIYPIEVKIWAGDQNKQLADYYKYYFPDRKDAKIYYLTPDGHSPSGESKGEGEDKLEDEQIVCISFTEKIKDWLKAVCDIKSAAEHIKYVIRNFMEVIDKMGQDGREMDMIWKNLGLDKEAFDYDTIRGAILFLKHRDEIWNEIRKNYIRSILDCGGTYVLCDCKKEEKGVSHIVLSVKKKGEADACAWICVETNLYIVAPIPENQNKRDDWTAYNDKYQWKYIPNSKSIIRLNVPTELDCNLKIDLAELLNGVVD